MLTLGFGLSTVWLTFGALLVGPPGGFPTINSLITNAFGYRASFWIFVPLFVIGATLLRSASRHVAEDIGKRKITEAADAAVRRERADGTAHLLMIRSLDAGYDGVQVVFGVDLDVGDGEMVAVLGTNGAGKSTLMRAISGLVVPTAGEVMFDGTAITTYEAHRITEAGILQVPGGRGIFPGLTVAECLRVAAWLYDRDDENLARATETVLGYFPVLARRWHTPAGSLSGGEQQMLSLSMAFIAQPKLLIIDELSLGLAPTVIESLLGIVKGIHEQGTAVILVEQSINLALRLCDRDIFMEKGQVVFSGSTADLLDRQDIVRAVLLGGAGETPPPTAASPTRATVNGSARRFDRWSSRLAASINASAVWWRWTRSTSSSTRARPWASSARTEPARPPSSNCSRASAALNGARSPWAASTSPRGRPTGGRSTDWAGPSRPPACGRASRCTSPW
jgi:branched-chain amino acid transport system ATP-binding protein